MNRTKTGNCDTCGVAVFKNKKNCDGCLAKSGFSLESVHSESNGDDKCRDRRCDGGCGGGSRPPIQPSAPLYLAANYSNTGATISAGFPTIPYFGTGLSTPIAIPVFNASASSNTMSSSPYSPFFMQSSATTPQPTTNILIIPKKGVYRTSMKFSASSPAVSISSSSLPVTNSVTFTVTRAGSTVLTDVSTYADSTGQSQLNYSDNRIIIAEAGDQLSWNYVFTTEPSSTIGWIVTDYSVGINAL